MSIATARSVVNGWDTVRYELLNTPISELGLELDGSPVEPFLDRLHNEMDRKRFEYFLPEFYLTDIWGCPDGVPVIGVPFYLADRRLARIEKEQMGALEDSKLVMMLLRHEAGHAVNYAYQLHKDEEWAELFGSFSRPYRDSFRPNPFSRQYVRHLVHPQYGRTYAQKHPDEDFAETFAVWLTPRSSWRKKYRYWPALRKLEYVDRLMKSVRDEPPIRTGGRLCTPVDEMDMLLAEHYGQKAERFREAAQGYVDDKLRDVFPHINGRRLEPADVLLTKHSEDLVGRVTRWSELDVGEVRTLIAKLRERAEFLGLDYRRRDAHLKLMDVTSLVTALAMDFAYTGRLTG